MIDARKIDQAFSDLRSTCGGMRDDYLGLLFLEEEHHVPRDKAVNQVAFGGNDYGLDGFHFDEKKRNLYLYQFKNSTSSALFKESMKRLIAVGMERIFFAPQLDGAKNQIILQLRSCMIDNRALIDQIIFRFVFTGDTEEARRSLALDKLREDLEEKRYYVHEFFKGRDVTFLVEFHSTTGRVRGKPEPPPSYQYDLDIGQLLEHEGPDGQRMAIGFIRLVDLHRMHSEIGPRFFEWNIRFGLGSGEAVNRALLNALRRIVLDGRESPDVFAFDHNGITLSAERVEPAEGHWHITSPRMLNGAQTTTTLKEFMEGNKDNPLLAESRERLEKLRVMCKIITKAAPEFVTRVTINNNRQNPVEPWNLHANDLIQLELQDKFRCELPTGIYYERQESASENLTQEDLELAGYAEGKAIELLKLAQVFLVTDGQLDKLSRMRLVFEDERVYDQVFSAARLKADVRNIVLCYKVQLRLRKVMNEIVDKGYNKYWWIDRARGLLWALLCQGILNDPDLESVADRFGDNMGVPAEFTAYLVQLGTTRCRPLLAQLVADPTYADKVAEEKMGFLRTSAAYKRCMEMAYKKWRWTERRLK
jgi:hypothetical protein